MFYSVQKYCVIELIGNKMKADSRPIAMFALFSVILTFHLCLPNRYQKYTTGNNNLCSHSGIKKSLKLGGRNEEHGILVGVTRTFYHWSGFKLFECKFEVKERQKNKIIAVIQKLALRRDEDGNCLDYIQFKSKSEESVKFCGIISLTSESYPKDSLAPAFIAHEDGKLDVTIYVANKALESNEELDLQIVFTSAQDCSVAPQNYYSTCGHNLCIRNEFFRDGVVNCPFTDCMDEEGCTTSSPGIHE